MLAAVLWGIAALLASIVMLALLPLGVRLAAQSAPDAFLRVEFRPFGGLAPWIGIFDSRRPQAPESGSPTEKTRRKQRRRPLVRRRGRGVETRRVLGALPGLLRGLLRVFRLERLELEVVFGLGDPADTGAVYGALAPPLVAAGYATGHPYAVRLTPDFGRAILEGRAEAEMTVTPARAIGPALRFAWAAFGPRR